MQRIRWMVVGLTALAVLAATTTVHAGTTDPKAPRFTDGQWDGTLQYSGKLDNQYTSASASGNGTFTMGVAGGTPSGDFSFKIAGSGIAGLDASIADLSLTGSGTIAGEATQPIFTIVVNHITGEGTSQGLTIPIDIQPIGKRSFTVNVKSSTCSQVVGSFSEQGVANLQAAGAQGLSASGYFVALRTASGTVAIDSVNALLHELDAIFQAAVDGTVTAADLLAVVKKAEDMAAALPGNAKCGLLKKPDAFHLAISTKVADLLSYVISSPDKFSTDQLVEIMWAGVQVGAIGAGAFDQKFSKDVLDDFEKILTERLQQAITAKDKQAIEDIEVAAVTFGFKDLLTLAKDE